jgi:hypothetical protein
MRPETIARSAARALLFLSCVLALTVAVEAQAPKPTPQPKPTQMRPKAKAATGEWRPLFDGSTTEGWRGYRSKEMPKGWTVVDHALTKAGSAADIVTTEEFGDFELELEWKIAPGGNAGIFYRGTEEYDHISWSAPEYQLLDDATARDGKDRLTSAAAAYGFYPSRAGVLKPAGEWNRTRILARGPHVEHWLNGEKVVEYELWSPGWEAKLKASKFAPYAGFGRAKKGVIGIQGDHDGELSLRNLRIRTLD